MDRMGESVRLNLGIGDVAMKLRYSTFGVKG